MPSLGSLGSRKPLKIKCTLRTKDQITGVAIRFFVKICQRIKAGPSKISLLYKKAYKGNKRVAIAHRLEPHPIQRKSTMFLIQVGWQCHVSID